MGTSGLHHEISFFEQAEILGFRMAVINVAVVSFSSGTTSGVTPQTSCRRQATDLSGVTARIGAAGLNLLTLWAVAPVFVRGMMAAAFSWLAMVLTAPLKALGIVLGRWLSIERSG